MQREQNGTGPTVRELRRADWPAVAAIYAEGIETGVATFETGPPSRQDWDAAHLADQRLVAEADGAVLGWAALERRSARW